MIDQDALANQNKQSQSKYCHARNKPFSGDKEYATESFIPATLQTSCFVFFVFFGEGGVRGFMV